MIGQHVERGEHHADRGRCRLDPSGENFVEQVIEAQELERRRLAGDIHDGISQRLVTLSYRLDAAAQAAKSIDDRSALTEQLDRARELAPGRDVYALEADWQDYWRRSGRPALRNPGAAFLGYVRTRVGGG